MKKIILIIIIFQFISCFSKAQVNEDWVNTYNGAGSADDRGNSLTVDESGNCFITGFATGSGTNQDILTISYDASGSTRWTQIYNSSSNGTDVGTVIKYFNGYVYVAGYEATSSNGYDFILIKYNSSNGNSSWSVTYNGAGNSLDMILDMTIDNSGFIYVTGKSTSNGNGLDIVTIKYNSSGSQQWVATYNNSRSNLDDYGNAIFVGQDGNIYVTGATTESSTTDYVTIKYNSSGSQQWLKKYDNGDGVDVANSIVIDETGGSANVCVTGTSTGNGQDILTVVYDNSDGTELWSQRINGYDNGNDWGSKVRVDNNGNVIVGGTSFISTSQDLDYFVVKYNSSGTEQWTAKYNGTGNNRDILYDLTLDANGNIYATGLSRNGTGLSSGDYATIKFDSDGNETWIIRYNSSYDNNDLARSIAVNNSGNVFITGMSENSSSLDIVTIQYSQDADLYIMNQIDQKSLNLKQNYPNPFNPKTNISFKIPVNCKVKITMFEVNGKQINTLLDQYFDKGDYEIIWDGTNYSSGVYYCMLETDKVREIRKLVLLK